MNENIKSSIVIVGMGIFVSSIAFFTTMETIRHFNLEKRCEDTKFYIDLIRAKKESPNATIIIQPVRNCECKEGK